MYVENKTQFFTTQMSLVRGARDGWRTMYLVTHSQLLKGPKGGPKQEITEEEGVGTRSLAHNTLRGRGSCWSSGMGLGRGDKLYSLTRACTQPTQSGQCIVGAPLVLRQTTGNTDTQDSPRPRLGGSHHLPPYSILVALRGGYIQMVLFLGTPEMESRNCPGWSPGTLGAHNSRLQSSIATRSEPKLQFSSRAFQRRVALQNRMLGRGRFLTFSGRESNCQFDSQPFFCP